MSPSSFRFSPCTVVLLTPLRRSGVACRMSQSEEERGQGPAGQRILVDEPHNVSGVPRSRVCGSCEHYFALPFVPYRLLHPFTGEGPEGQATCATCGARRPQQEGWLLEIQKGVLCVLRVLSVPFSCCLWSCLWLCAMRFARSRRFAGFVQLPPVFPLGLPPFVLHVQHVLQIPRDRLWTWIQDDATTESSDEEESEEESEEEAEEAEEEDEEEEEGSDTASVEEEDDPSLAPRAPHSTHLEVARMAAQPKGTPVKAKPEAKPEPEELSKKNKEKTKSPPKKSSKGKQKVEEKPKHVRYAVQGEPHRTMPIGATPGEKYQGGAAYNNDVQAMQRTLESDYEVSLGRVCQHYKVCLTSAPRIGPGAASGDGRAGVQCADGPPLWHEECTKHGCCQRTV